MGNSESLAVKVLQKGFVFRDNVLYPPMKPDTLKLEIDILRALDGKAFNLVLDSIYESSSKIYLVTEICAGGELLEYTSRNMAEGLRTEEVSRIAYQLLSAINHCESRGVLHRDIKPENIMFKANTKSAELRLIDFGCATLDLNNEIGKEHVTYAGTAFYNSPEMFKKRYTSKTDVFSAGVVLYVLVAGYPADRLQAAFNLLHKSKRDLKTLPGMPDGMPDTYYEMINKMLTYHWKSRKSAKEMMNDEFALFHQAKKGRIQKTQSVVLLGTGEKAAAGLGFVKFQRSLTTLLGAMLERGDLLSLMSFVANKVSADDNLDSKLGAIEVKQIKSILETMGKIDCVAAIEKQQNAQVYDSFSYDYNLLKPFTEKQKSTHKCENPDALSGSFRFSKKNVQHSVRMLSSSERPKTVRKVDRSLSGI